MADYSLEEIEEAKTLFLQGYSVRKIGKALDIPYGTIQIWKQKYKWEKEKPEYPINSLKAQLTRVTKLVDILEPKLDELNILKPSAEEKELLANYRRLSELQLKLIKQLSVLEPIDNKPAKKNIFM